MGFPVGSAKVSGGVRDATLARHRLLNRLPDDRRKEESARAAQRPSAESSAAQMCVCWMFIQ